MRERDAGISTSDSMDAQEDTPIRHHRHRFRERISPDAKKLNEKGKKKSKPPKC
jgi:hypothetical protein